jgi:glutamate synthase domain-containing protein 3
MNDLRGRVTLTVDGGFQRGFDVVVAAILGAEEFGFGTSVLVALGCVMARQCHLNTCPVGIASQKPELREKFPGIPEQAVNYLYSVANDVRAILAKIGVKSLDDIIGRTELIKQKTKANYNKTKNIDLSRIIADPDPSNLKPRKRVIERNNRVEDPIDFELINFFRKSIDELVSNKIELNISTVDRTVGAILSGAIAKKYGNKGLPDDTINVSFKGIAGQSFGGYLINGVNLNLEGEANDYVGKSMNGGRIAIYPNSSTNFDIQGNSIVGNTVLYGATGGSLFAAGAAGERFCVRNSGALTVVEGVGDHACEYMTGGEVYILGPVGKNLGAGMSGGITYIYNENQNLDEQINPEMVFIDEISDRDKIKIRNIVELHYDLTRSLKAKEILENFDVEIKSFVRIIPKEINRILDLNGINIDDFDFLNPKLN